MLMPYQVKIVLLPVPFLPCAFHLPLELDDILAQYEPCLKKAHEHAGRYGHEMLVPPGIAHENSAMFTMPEHAEAHNRYLAHLLCELGDVMHA